MNDSAARFKDSQAKPPIFSLLFKTLQLTIIAILNLFLWPFYAIGRRIYYRPPNVPHWAQVKRYLQLAWSAQPSFPGLSRRGRIWLTLGILRKLLMTPLTGLAWLLDELLYGRSLNATEITAPLFVISGGRSGSTQMTRYLEADPSVTAPNLLQSMFPYLWLWRLAPRTIGRIFTPEKVRARLESMMPAELLERHEFNPFKADTFDGAMFSAHLNHLAMYMGPEVASQEFSFAIFPPQDRTRLENDFVQLIDRIGRKQQLFIGDVGAERPRRLFIKGHFLYGAEALERAYPDATFLTLVRDPVSRLQSGINYLWVNPSDPAMGPPPWAWLAQTLRQSESDYCRIEQAWFSQENGARRCVIRFADFVADLEGTMQHVYQTCFDQEQLPPHVPRVHPSRERKNYIINRSLAELGIDAEQMRIELADYIAWCQSTTQQQELE